jgi:hypothetical protein
MCDTRNLPPSINRAYVEMKRASIRVSMRTPAREESAVRVACVSRVCRARVARVSRVCVVRVTVEPSEAGDTVFPGDLHMIRQCTHTAHASDTHKLSLPLCVSRPRPPYSYPIC